MIVLIDYDNVPALSQQRGVKILVQQILDELPERALPHGSEVSVRIYGGWYRLTSLTKRAQLLVEAIDANFPAPLALSGANARRVVRVRVALARSLLVDPGRRVFHTYRPRGIPENLAAEQLPFAGCIDHVACPLAPIVGLLSANACGVTGCKAAIENVMTKPEQKLVDTMLTADLIDCAVGGAHITLVSTDDDFIPGIFSALQRGVTLHHVHTRPGRRTGLIYRKDLPATYREYSIGARP